MKGNTLGNTKYFVIFEFHPKCGKEEKEGCLSYLDICKGYVSHLKYILQNVRVANCYGIIKNVHPWIITGLLLHQ